MKYIQSYILNLAPVSSLNELYQHLIEDETPGNIERFYLESLFENSGEVDGWTAPRWAKRGDICFFMQSVTTLQRLKKLKNELINKVDKNLTKSKSDYLFLSENDSNEAKLFWYYKLEQALSQAEISYRAFGGKIFAIGKVSSIPEMEKRERDSLNHWGTDIYCKYGDVHILDEPIAFQDFKNYVSFSQQGSITPAFGSSYEDIKKLILKNNPKLSSFFKGCVSSPIPMTKINKSNWLEVTGIHNFDFLLEAAFRRYYTDYLLAELRDSGKLFSECKCSKRGVNGIIDNVFTLGGKYLAVEIKLNHRAEINLFGQLNKYENPDSVCLKDGLDISGKDMYKAVLLIDTTGVFLFRRGNLNKVEHLKSIKTKKDIEVLKKKLCALLTNK